MKKIILEILDKYAKDSLNINSTYIDNLDFDDLADDLVEKVVNIESKEKWISVEDRLPESDDIKVKIAVLKNGAVIPVWYWFNQFVAVKGNTEIPINNPVILYRELPKAPELPKRRM